MRATANRTEGRPAWNETDWSRAEKAVRNLRQRIYRAAREGGPPQGEVPSTAHASERGEPGGLCPARLANERGPQHAGRGQSGGQNSGGKGRAGRASGSAPAVEGVAGQTGVCSEGERQATAARHSDQCRQGNASGGEERAGTRVGGPLRALQLRVPAGPKLPRRHRAHLHLCPLRRTEEVGCGCGHPGSIGCRFIMPPGS